MYLRKFCFGCNTRKINAKVATMKKKQMKRQQNGSVLRHLGQRGAALKYVSCLDLTVCSQRLGNFNQRLKAGNRRSTRADFLYNGTFHEAISPVLIMAQCFCIMPVRGVSARKVNGLFFSWMCFRTLYTLTFVATTSADTVLTLIMVLNGVIDVRNIEPFIFHMSMLISTLKFLNVARKWPELMRKWAKVERQMPKYHNWRMRERLAKRIRTVTFVIMMLSLTEHMLCTISNIHFANYCPARKDPIESYFTTVSQQIFDVFPYSNWLAWLGKVENVLLGFGWNYLDVFLMNIGIGLSELLARICYSIEKHVGKAMPEAYWTHKRLQYRAIYELINNVDDTISGLLLLSFANDLYFICIQLLKTINKMPSAAHAVYFYFSLSFLIMRSLAVLLFVSSINDRAREPLRLLKLVPANAYHSDVARFANEIAIDDVALTGLKFFNVTRKLVLTAS